MEYFYLGSLFIPSLLLSFLLIFFGLENKKGEEIYKGNLSKFVYYLQFISSSIYIFIHEGNKSIDFTFVKLSNYHYDLMFNIETYQIGFAIIFSLLFILIEKMSFNYLHAEEEHAKFYGLKSILNISIMFFIFSSNIDFLFFSWELVGLTSALLISYFYRRNQAVENSLFAFSVYRICDAAFLIIGLMLFYFHHTENINYQSSGMHTTLLGILIFITIMGKSGIYPLSSWLPLALEGPTPSSNLYYMAISTHLGALLMIKTHSLWETSLPAKIIMGAMLLTSIILHNKSAKVQPSIKAAIAYSTLSQVSVILLEIVFGFYNFALVHIGFHMVFRFIQMTTSTSIIEQHRNLEKEVGLVNQLSINPTSHFYALNGFGSEYLIIRIFKIIIYPFLILDNIENYLFGNLIHTNKKSEFALYKLKSNKE